MNGYFWQLPDGRIWDSAAACFIDAIPAGFAADQVGGLEDLKARIRFYGLALGELAELEDLRPGDGYKIIDGRWVKVHFTRKDFQVLCGLDKMDDLNAVIIAGNPSAKTVHDLLMSSDYIDVTDPTTALLLGRLTTPVCGSVITADDVARILAGVPYVG